MGNLVIGYGRSKEINKIVQRYKEIYQASVFEIETENNYGFFDKLSNDKSKVRLKRKNINLNNYDNIILVTGLWHDKVPAPVLRFLEQQTGKIKNIIYVLYNNNRDDKVIEFDKMDKILNLRRDKSYFVNVHGKDIHVRVYQ